MPQVDLDGTPVEYQLSGAGEPVVLVHARPFVSWYAPLAEQLADRTVLRYRRALPADRRFGIEDDGELCSRLLHHVGFDRPHVVGHSYGGLVALELARRVGPELRSLALLEPATSGSLAPERARAVMAALLAAADVDAASAMTDFLRAVGGEDARTVLDRLVPGAYAEALAHADGFFGTELPAVIAWSFTAEDASGIPVPVLNLHASHSVPRFAEGAAIIQSWFPHAEKVELQGATHLMPAQDPVATAEALRRFWDHL